MAKANQTEVKGFGAGTGQRGTFRVSGGGRSGS